MIPTMYLRTVEIFDGLTDEELEEVGKCCEEFDLGEETTLFEENDAAEFLYSLVDGEVSLRYRMPAKDASKENTISTLDPGGTFGWSSRSLWQGWATPQHRKRPSVFKGMKNDTAWRKLSD